jgi:hypothetical protein
MLLRKLPPAVDKHQRRKVQNRRKRFKNINLYRKEITVRNLKFYFPFLRIVFIYFILFIFILFVFIYFFLFILFIVFISCCSLFINKITIILFRNGINQILVGIRRSPIPVLVQFNGRLLISVVGSKIENKFLITFNLFYWR